MIETALHAHLAARGAVHEDDRGVALPRHFGDPEAEYRALREATAIYDLGFRTLVRAAGGPSLEGTYSAKALAAALAHARTMPDERMLFWLTFDGRWLANS